MRTSGTITYNVFRLQVTLLRNSILETMQRLSRQTIELSLSENCHYKGSDSCRGWGGARSWLFRWVRHADQLNGVPTSQAAVTKAASLIEHFVTEQEDIVSSSTQHRVLVTKFSGANVPVNEIDTGRVATDKVIINDMTAR